MTITRDAKDKRGRCWRQTWDATNGWQPTRPPTSISRTLVKETVPGEARPNKAVSVQARPQKPSPQRSHRAAHDSDAGATAVKANRGTDAAVDYLRALARAGGTRHYSQVLGSWSKDDQALCAHKLWLDGLVRFNGSIVELTFRGARTAGLKRQPDVWERAIAPKVAQLDAEIAVRQAQKAKTRTKSTIARLISEINECKAEKVRLKASAAASRAREAAVKRRNAENVREAKTRLRRWHKPTAVVVSGGAIESNRRKH